MKVWLNLSKQYLSAYRKGKQAENEFRKQRDFTFCISYSVFLIPYFVFHINVHLLYLLECAL
jgi:hypothetical protein